MAEPRDPNFRQDTTDDNFTVGERVEVNGVSGTIDHIGGFQVRSDASTRIINKRRNDVRDPTSHQTGEQINLRAGSQVEIKMSNNTWVPGTLLIKYYRVILDGREPSMFAHINIRRPQEQAPQAQAPQWQAPAPAPAVAQPVVIPPPPVPARQQRQAPPTPAAPAPAPAAQPMQMGVEPNPSYRFGENVEILTQNVWIPAVLSGGRNDSLHNFVIFDQATGRRIQRPKSMVYTLQHQPATNLNVRIGDTVFHEADPDRPNRNFILGMVVDKIYYVDYTTPNGILIRNEEKRTNQIRRPQEQDVAAVAPIPVAAEPLPFNEDYNHGDAIEFFDTSRNDWRLGHILNENGYMIISNTRLEVLRKNRNRVRNPRNQQTGSVFNLRVGDNIEYLNDFNQWVSGTILNKQYIVTTGANEMWVSHFQIRRRNQNEQRVAPPAPAAAPAAAPVAAPARQQRQAPPTPATPAPAPAPIQMGVEPNPPYRFGEILECLIRNVWLPATLSSMINNSLHSFNILEQETGRIIERPLNMARTLLEQPATNLNVRIGDTVFYEANEDRPIGNYIQGMVVDKRYNVDFRSENGRLFSYHAKSTNEIRRRQGQAVAQATAQAVPRPPAPPQLGPGGLAFEIHNAFDSFKLENFMNIVRTGNHRNNDSPLQPLIDNINANPNISAVEKADLTVKIERIFATLRQYSNYEINKDKIIDCIQYVLMQPQEFINIYIKTFITDCLKAYTRGNTQSCIKGMYERVFFSFRDTVSTLCLDQIQGTGAAPLCKPEYIEIFNCFYEDLSTESLNDYAQRWFREKGEAVENFSPEARIEDFIDFIRRELNNNARFMQTERSVIRYAAENINVLFGGKRKTIKRKQRKTIKMKNKHHKSRRN
jgi:hypothetical protein